MKKIITTLILVFSSTYMVGQEVLLTKPDQTNYDPVKNGPGRAHQHVTVIGFGFNGQIGQLQDLKQIVWRSANFNIGGRYIGRLAKPISFLWDYGFDFYNMTYTPQNNFALTEPIAIKPNRLLVDRMSVESGVGFRLYLNKRRGAYFGNHIDFGVLGGIHLRNNWDFRERNDNGYSVTLRADNLIAGADNRTYAGAYFRLGFAKVQIPVRVITYANNTYAVFSGLSYQF